VTETDVMFSDVRLMALQMATNEMSNIRGISIHMFVTGMAIMSQQNLSSVYLRDVSSFKKVAMHFG
jgi:hypothetical protein